MPRNSLFSAVIIFSLLLSIPGSTYSAGVKRNLTIEGLKIFRSEELKKILSLESAESGKISNKEITGRITRFYQKNGYPLIKIYVIENTPENLTLYVNEGRLAKIIIHNLNNYYSLKVKQIINFPGRIYNTEVTSQIISAIKTKHGYPEIRTELLKIADYSDSFFQIDREFRKIRILNNTLKIFEEYPAEYDLHFYPDKKGTSNGFSINKDGFSFNIDYDYPSQFIPEVSYYKNSLFAEKDFFEIEGSSGFNPGLKGLISIPPSNTLQLPPERSFSQIKMEYKFHPYNSDFFGPVLRGKLYQSESSRVDLGLSRYQYILARSVLAPEFTFLKYFNIYAGIGAEKVFFYDSRIDETAEKHHDPEDGNEVYPFLESRIKIDPVPIRIGNRIDKYLVYTLTEYIGNNTSREMQVTCAYDFEFSNLSIYSFKFKSDLNFFDTPFNHNAGVTSQFFKGFSGRGFFTNREFSVSNEYRFSVYQDYFYAGLFMDWIIFEPEGYKIEGTKHGYAAGPTGRFLFYDQFELIVYYSFDRLLPDDTTGTNLQIKFRKKW